MELFFLLLILIPLLVLTICSLYHAYKAQNNGSYHLAIVCLILLIATYSVGVLNYKVTGDNFGLEKKVEKIKYEQEQLNNIVQILVKMIYVSNDQALLSSSSQHTRQLEKYENELKDYLGEEFNETIDNLLKSLNQHTP